MTLFLASVTSSQEAELAINGGADIVDLKDPAKGALGALELPVVRDTVKAIAGRRPASAVIGDLPMKPESIASAVETMAATGVDYVKVGLFAGPEREDCIRRLAPLARRIGVVGVIFADSDPDRELVPLMAECGFAGAMIDTARKNGGRLLDQMNLATVDCFVRSCRSHGLLAGLAGSLEAADVPRLLLLSPDYLGFRTALCDRHDRLAGLDPAALNLIRGLISQDPRGYEVERPKRENTDYWLVAARGYSGEPTHDSTTTDRVLVHDFEVSMRVGAYENEREKEQRVRFNVNAEVIRATKPAQDMRDVLSYDVITDGIRLIVAEGHIPLLETLAERVAKLALDHPQVQRVTVKVEKIEVGSGRVGVEITRERPAVVAKVFHLFPTAAGKGKSTE
jgi:FolB domain-containing protein